MAMKIIGKTFLSSLGFCQNPQKMEGEHSIRLQIIGKQLPPENVIISTSMTGFNEVEETGGVYFPKVRKYAMDLYCMFDPEIIYKYCVKGEDSFRPGCDFVIFNSKSNITAITFSREAPIIAFESSNGMKALGTILRPSLMKYGDTLFEKIKEGLGGEITATLVACNHFEYPEGSIPSLFENLCAAHNMNCIIGKNSEEDPECYHRGEKGNHVVALW